MTTVAGCGALVTLALGTPLSGQVIRGTLLDAANGAPIDLGLIVMYTEAGDSVGLTVSDARGHFEIRSDEPGRFALRASALGYKETMAGVFALPAGSSMSLQYRLGPRPLDLDEIVVRLDRPVRDASLVRNGFVRRMEQGFGHFITPLEIQRAAAVATEDLFRGVNGVFVPAAGGMTSFLGERVLLRNAGGGQCSPALYVDGLKVSLARGESLSSVVPKPQIEGIEVYTRAIQVPAEYRAGVMRPERTDGAIGGACGVIVIWTKR